MRLTNITPEHFAMADGRNVLTVDDDGSPQISPAMMTDADRSLAAIALALYTHGTALNASRAHVATVAQWVRQYQP
jgi:hypothetical protein